jgi:hypothetical protein
VAASDRRPLATALLLLLALAAPPLAGASSSSPTPAPLAAGQRGSYSWTLKASRLAGPWPCLSVAITHHHGPFSYDRSRFRECVLSSPGLSRSAQPLLVGGTHLGAGASPRMTVFGVLAAPGTRRVRVTVSDGLEAASLSARLKPISLRVGRAKDLRFALLALPGRHCVERLAIASAIGKALWQGSPGEYDCGYAEPAAADPPTSPASSPPAATPEAGAG